MIAFFRLVLVTMGLALIAGLSAVLTMRFAIHGAEVTTPDFKGMTVALATQKAASMGLNLSMEGELYSTELPAGRVITQTPAAGSVVRREWQVRVTGSLGPQKVAIPNVIGEQEQLASIAIRRIGLELGTVAHMPDALTVPGTVLTQSPGPHAAGLERPSISILVADAEAPVPAAFIMPDFTGQPALAAMAMLEHAGLATASERDALPWPDGRSAGAPGTVVRQSPLPGDRVTPKTVILFDVAR